MRRIALLSCISALLLLAASLCGCGSVRSLLPSAEPTEEQVSIDTKGTAAATARPTSAPTPTPDPASAAKQFGDDFAVSMNMLRVVKNRYYNVLDGALAEDNKIAPLLYQMLDYVYGDSVLEAFADCFGDEEEYRARLEELGYTDIELERSDGQLTVNAVIDGVPRVFSARFDNEREAASLTVLQDEELIRIFEWRAVDGGYAIQFARALPKTNSRSAEDGEGEEDGEGSVSNVPSGIDAEFSGYRAYILDDATGDICAGYYCIGELESIFDLPAVDEAFIHRNMFSYYTYVLTPETVTVRSDGAELVHTIGEIPEEEDDEDGGDFGDLDDDEEAELP